jgi:hypothetical protein
VCTNNVLFHFAGTPHYYCAFWHNSAETAALKTILQRLTPSITPPWEDDSSDEEPQTAAAGAAGASSSGLARTSTAGVPQDPAAGAVQLAVQDGSRWPALSNKSSANDVNNDAAAAAATAAAVAATAAAAAAGGRAGEGAGAGGDLEALRFLYFVSRVV